MLSVCVCVSNQAIVHDMPRIIHIPMCLLVSIFSVGVPVSETEVVE